MGDVIRIKIVW
ncbi:unnamed protein product, partial [Adineta steineri]